MELVHFKDVMKRNPPPATVATMVNEGEAESLIGVFVSVLLGITKPPHNDHTLFTRYSFVRAIIIRLSNTFKKAVPTPSKGKLIAPSDSD